MWETPNLIHCQRDTTKIANLDPGHNPKMIFTKDDNVGTVLISEYMAVS
jgi:hypothetical protein